MLQRHLPRKPAAEFGRSALQVAMEELVEIESFCESVGATLWEN